MSVENDDGDDPAAPERLDDLPRGVRQRLEAFVPELVKKTITAGMGAVFTTEEGLRRLSKDITLPKEVVSYIVNTAGSTKDELLRIIASEFREFLQTINLSEEIARMLTMLSFEVKTEIRFIPNDQKYTGVEPQVKAEVRVKRSDERRRRRRFRRSHGGGSTPPPEDGPKG